ncbi:MAG: glycine betaine ABC transporter substrate-binding protein [Bacillota bacterium]
MSIKRILAMSLIVVFLAGSLFVAGCGDDGEAVVVGSKEFTEQLVLGQIAILALEHHGIPTEDETGLGGTTVVREAQEAGDVDLYWEYTGTALITHLGHDEVITDPEECYQTVKEEDSELNQLAWLDYTPFNNTYTIMMRQSDADELGIETISDLAEAINEGVEAPDPGEWNFATDHEYSIRDDGYPGLQELYDFEFDEVVTMDLGITYGALRDGDVATAMGFATDGRIAAFELVNLEDDKQFHPVYNCSPVVREEALEMQPEIADILNPIAAALDEKTMSSLNMQVDIEEKLPSEVAEEWLLEQGFIE